MNFWRKSPPHQSSQRHLRKEKARAGALSNVLSMYEYTTSTLETRERRTLNNLYVLPSLRDYPTWNNPANYVEKHFKRSMSGRQNDQSSSRKACSSQQIKL